MAQLINIDVDPSGAIRALDRLGVAVERHLKEAARVTAARVRDEARARIARRTGETADNIVAEESRDQNGYVVYVKTPADGWPNLDLGLEFGTRFMLPRPFLHDAARVESGPYRREVEAAIRQAIDDAEGGLGG